MLKLKCQGLETNILEEELVTLLQNSELAWYLNRYANTYEVYVVGSETDLLMTGELV